MKLLGDLNCWGHSQHLSSDQDSQPLATFFGQEHILITKEDLLYSTENYVQYYVIICKGNKFKEDYKYVHIKKKKQKEKRAAEDEMVR